MILDLFGRAFVLFMAYEMRADPLDPEAEYRIVAGVTDKSYVIRMRQIMFALAYREFGGGNQEAFFRFIQKYNKTAPEGKHLGPKKFTSTKSMRAYLKKGQAQVYFGASRKILNNYYELAFPVRAAGLPTFPDFIWNC